MVECRSWRVVLGALVAALLLSSSRVHAQSIVDARRVEFTPSAHHNTLGDTGAPMVERYSIDVYVAGTIWPIATANLGKPAPESDGMIRVEFVSLLGVTLQTGVTYEAIVEAIGPGGRSGGMRTNTFSFGGVACAPTASTPAQSFAAAGGTGSSTVTTSAGCVWNAASSVGWITITSGTSGSGPGSVAFTVAENTTTASRSGTITIAGASFTITQAGAACSYSISPAAKTFTAAGGTGTSAVTALPGCAWTATSNAAWISITSGSSGSGSGSTNFSVVANTSTSSRSGTLTIAGATFNVTQAGASCSYSISPNSQSFAASGGTGTSSVTTSAGCAWGASSNASWITVTSGASTSGSGSAGFSVAANTDTTGRSGTLTIASATFTVTQAAAACSYSAFASIQTFGNTGGTGSVTVSAGSGCGWTASSSATWISITGGSSGSGAGTTTFTVAPNTGTSARSATVTVAGVAFTITQTAPSACSFSISPTTQWFTIDGGSGNSTVTTAANCAWTAESNVSWVAMINAGPGQGGGKVTFIVATNSGQASRTGTLRVADKTFTVRQAGTGCSYVVSPSSHAIAAAGGTASSALTTSAGCDWEASSNTSWITITAGASGSGSGTVAFTAAANTDTAARTGSLWVAGTTVTVNQAAPAGCATSVSPTSRSFTSSGGSGNSTVTAASTCAWDAVSNVAWVAVINAGPGRGSGTVSFIVATNSSGVSRTGTLTIAGQTFTVTQTASATCTYSISPGSVTVRASATTATVNVVTQSGCAWSASGAPSWLTLTTSGAGPGTATLAITANTAKTARSATLTIAGQALTVTQNGRIGAPANIRVVK